VGENTVEARVKVVATEEEAVVASAVAPLERLPIKVYNLFGH
jgi:hypothetical protein